MHIYLIIFMWQKMHWASAFQFNSITSRSFKPFIMQKTMGIVNFTTANLRNHGSRDKLLLLDWVPAIIISLKYIRLINRLLMINFIFLCDPYPILVAIAMLNWFSDIWFITNIVEWFSVYCSCQSRLTTSSRDQLPFLKDPKQRARKAGW